MKTKQSTPRSVVIASGGLDSTVMLYYVKTYHDPNPLVISFNYGQRHVKELECIKKTCEKLGLSLKLVDISVIRELMYSSALTGDGAVPEEHYSHESQKLTVVPNRNAVMINLAIAYAITNKCNRVYYAAHWNDRTIYPDCRWEFVQAQNLTAKLANDKPEFEVLAPFVHKSKADIVKIGIELGVDFRDTWSCYKGEEKACGVCGTCVERLEAFEKNSRNDPIEYSIPRKDNVHPGFSPIV